MPEAPGSTSGAEKFQDADSTNLRRHVTAAAENGSKKGLSKEQQTVPAVVLRADNSRYADTV